MNMMRLWMRRATPEERVRLAEGSGTSVGNLAQYAGGHRQPSAARGQEIEHVALKLAKEADGRLPDLYRTDLVEACRNCDFARICLGADVVDRADFHIVEPSK